MRLKKYIAEFLGTAILVLFGCGTAVFCGGLSGGTGNGTLGVVSIALAFGLSTVAGAYSIGHISGCHVNPAVSLAMFINGKLDIIDLIGYIVSQVAGAFAGSGLLMLITKETAADGLGSNGYGELSSVGISMTGAIVVEIVLTFVFVLTVLGVTSSEKYSSVAGIVIGLTLTFVHIIGIPLTGTSVNPARSLAPAVLDGGIALNQVWVFLVAPLAGAALAGIIFKFLFKPKAI
ncbi:MAG: MIP family channel protein [Ruminococcaceae bacterium]|nr:MIP family channel protein [Oscillospiraceae bacterium]